MKNHTYAKQLARFPYCRIYRHFFNRLTENCQIRKQGEGLLYRYMSLFSLVNFRPALRTVHGQRYVIQAGEWVLNKKYLFRERGVCCLRNHESELLYTRHSETV